MAVRKLQITQPIHNIGWDIENKEGSIHISNISYDDFVILVSKVEKLLPKKVREIR